MYLGLLLLACFIVTTWARSKHLSATLTPSSPTVSPTRVPTTFPNSQFPTRYKTRIPTTTNMPSKPTLTPSAGGSVASNGDTTNNLRFAGGLNVVDITLIVFFSIFGGIIVGVCAFVAYENMTKQRGPPQGEEYNPANAPKAAYQDDE